MYRRRRDGRETTTGRIRGSPRELTEASRDLRRGMTPAEEALWQALRGQRLAGLRLRRQHPVGPFVLDFACPVRLLAIELDSAVHLTQREEDAARSELLEAYGWEVLRFPNDAVFADLDAVLGAIESAACSRPIARGWNTGAASHGSDQLPSPKVGGRPLGTVGGGGHEGNSP
jgi:very-short-patch-repair endonuclease